MKGLLKGMIAVAVACVGMLTLPGGASAVNLKVATGGPLYQLLPSPVSFNQIATADFNDDGLDDLAATTATEGTMIWLADGDGTFTLSYGVNEGVEQSWLETGDFDDDGNVDLLIGDKNYPGTMRTYVGNGDGTFGDVVAGTFDFNGWMPSTINSLAIGDVDDDGNLDAVAGINSRQYQVARGNGDGTFSLLAGPVQFPIDNPPVGAGFEWVAIGDYDADGNQDLALSIRSFTAAGGVYVAEGAGDGTFTPLASTPVPGSNYENEGAIESIDTARIDSNPGDDLTIVMRAGQQNVRTLVGSPQSLVQNPNPNWSTSLFPTFLYGHAAADLDGNGYDDVAAGTDDSIGVALNNAGALSPAANTPFGLTNGPFGNPHPLTVLSGDFNGDDAPDIVTFSSNANDPNQTRAVFPLINLPQVTVPAQLQFGDVPAGESSQLTLTVTNTGGAPALYTGNGPTITGDDSDLFTVDPEAGCEDGIPAGATCDFEVTYSPGAPGSGFATLNLDFVSIPGVDGTHDVVLTGTGTAPGISVDPESLDFGGVRLGDQTSEVVTVESTGALALTVDELNITGADAEDFSVAAEDCLAAPIAPSGDCTITVQFDPSATGTAEAMLEIGSDAANVEVPLTADAVDPGITLSPASHDFGSAEIGGGGTRPSREFVVTSTGTTPAQIADVTLSPAGDGSFRITGDGCGGPLAVGATCAVTVTFDPEQGEPGMRTAGLAVDWKAGVAEAALTGTATAAPKPPDPPNPPAPAPASLRLSLKSAKKAKRGKTLMITATVSNGGEATSGAVTLKAAVPKKLAGKVRPVKVGAIGGGSSSTKKLKIKVKKHAAKGKKLKVKVTASAPGTPAAAATRTVKIR